VVREGRNCQASIIRDRHPHDSSGYPPDLHSLIPNANSRDRTPWDCDAAGFPGERQLISTQRERSLFMGLDVWKSIHMLGFGGLPESAGGRNYITLDDGLAVGCLQEERTANERTKGE
jgi:hypothetical protein